VERSTLWRAGVLSAEEKAELEREWRREFETVQTPDFSMNTGCEILTGARAQTAHYRWADVPAELVQRWTAEHKRRRRRGAPLEGGATGVAKKDRPRGRDGRDRRGVTLKPTSIERHGPPLSWSAVHGTILRS